MAKNEKPGKQGTVQITMDRSFSEFRKEDQDAFEKELSEVTKTDEKDIKMKKYKRGCVLFEGELDQTIIDQLLYNYESRNRGPVTDDSVKLNAFVENHSIKQLFQIEKARPDIITSRKSHTARNPVRPDRGIVLGYLLGTVNDLTYDSSCFMTDNSFLFGIVSNLRTLLAARRLYTVSHHRSLQEPYPF